MIDPLLWDWVSGRERKKEERRGKRRRGEERKRSSERERARENELAIYWDRNDKHPTAAKKKAECAHRICLRGSRGRDSV